MRLSLFKSLVVLSAVFFAVAAHASQSETTVFPPKTPAGATCPAGETTVLAWNNGAATTYCLGSDEIRDLAIPDQTSAQVILQRALPGCAVGEHVVKTETGFSCEKAINLPICTDKQYLWSDGKALSCRDFETKVCTPNWVTTGVGTCSASCGGGVQDVYQSDGCGNTRTGSQACNTQSCGVTCTPGSKTFSTAGTYNFVVPNGYKAITAEVWGGGQFPIIFGWTGDLFGNAGASSSFNGSLLATGGGPGRTHPGVGSGGDVNLTGANAIMAADGSYAVGGSAPNGGMGGFAPDPAHNANPNGVQPGGGGGNSGCVYGLTACLGGASGGYARKIYTSPDLADATNIPVVVGAGGDSPGVTEAYPTTWGKGGTGMVRVEWTCK